MLAEKNEKRLQRRTRRKGKGKRKSNVDKSSREQTTALPTPFLSNFGGSFFGGGGGGGFYPASTASSIAPAPVVATPVATTPPATTPSVPEATATHVAATAPELVHEAPATQVPATAPELVGEAASEVDAVSRAVSPELVELSPSGEASDTVLGEANPSAIAPPLMDEGNPLAPTSEKHARVDVRTLVAAWHNQMDAGKCLDEEDLELVTLLYSYDTCLGHDNARSRIRSQLDAAGVDVPEEASEAMEAMQEMLTAEWLEQNINALKAKDEAGLEGLIRKLEAIVAGKQLVYESDLSFDDDNASLIKSVGEDFEADRRQSPMDTDWSQPRWREQADGEAVESLNVFWRETDELKRDLASATTYEEIAHLTHRQRLTQEKAKTLGIEWTPFVLSPYQEKLMSFWRAAEANDNAFMCANDLESVAELAEQQARLKGQARELGITYSFRPLNEQQKELLALQGAVVELKRRWDKASLSEDEQDMNGALDKLVTEAKALDAKWQTTKPSSAVIESLFSDELRSTLHPARTPSLTPSLLVERKGSPVIPAVPYVDRRIEHLESVLAKTDSTAIKAETIDALQAHKALVDSDLRTWLEKRSQIKQQLEIALAKGEGYPETLTKEQSQYVDLAEYEAMKRLAKRDTVQPAVQPIAESKQVNLLRHRLNAVHHKLRKLYSEWKSASASDEEERVRLLLRRRDLERTWTDERLEQEIPPVFDPTEDAAEAESRQQFTSLSLRSILVKAAEDNREAWDCAMKVGQAKTLLAFAEIAKVSREASRIVSKRLQGASVNAYEIDAGCFVPALACKVVQPWEGQVPSHKGMDEAASFESSLLEAANAAQMRLEDAPAGETVVSNGSTITWELPAEAAELPAEAADIVRLKLSPKVRPKPFLRIGDEVYHVRAVAAPMRVAVYEWGLWRVWEMERRESSHEYTKCETLAGILSVFSALKNPEEHADAPLVLYYTRLPSAQDADLDAPFLTQ